jgi:chorismate mutase
MTGMARFASYSPTPGVYGDPKPTIAAIGRQIDRCDEEIQTLTAERDRLLRNLAAWKHSATT